MSHMCFLNRNLPLNLLCPQGVHNREVPLYTHPLCQCTCLDIVVPEHSPEVFDGVKQRSLCGDVGNIGTSALSER